MESNDPRPLLSDLLASHASAIDNVREMIQGNPLFKTEDRYDNIWILRFVLSHKGNVKKASDAALRTMEFRKEHKLNELGDMRGNLMDHTKPISEQTFEAHRKYLEFCSSDALMWTLPDKDRGLVAYVTPFHVDMDGLSKQMKADDVLAAYMYNNEAMYQILDEISRRTGRLTKLLRVVDTSDMAFSKMNRDYARLDGKANKVMEDFFPQLLGRVLVINPPVWMDLAWRIMHVFFPRRFLEKMEIVSPSKRPEQKAKYFADYISEENLPVRFGGKNEVWPPPAAAQAFAEPKT